MNCFKKMTCFVFISATAACGGSGSDSTGSENDELVLDNTLPLQADSDAASGLAIAVANVDGDTATGTGVLNRGVSTFSGDILVGAYDVDTEVLTLTSGGQATFSDLQEFSGVVLIETPGGGTQFGVAGVTPSQPPSGRITYSGTTQVSIVTNAGAYELAGDMSAVYDLSGSFNELQVTLDNLDGTEINNFGQPIGNVTDVATIDLSVDTVNADGSFSDTGGVFLDSGVLPALSGNEDVAHVGSFFGPGYAEVGGAFAINDGATGSLQIKGTYIGDQ